LTNKLAAAALSAILLAVPQIRADDHEDEHEGKIKRVLLISIDGMHALDFQNCVASGDCPNLANLAPKGVIYTRATTSRPSDSSPGLATIVSGASSKTHGEFYDVAYDRALAPPAKTTGNGVAGDPSFCTPGVFPGTTTEYEEGIEFDQTLLNGGAPGASPTEGGVAAIDPMRLPRDPANNCAPVWPWNFMRANTIFGVLHSHGFTTAWSDKHATYSSVSGPTGTDVPSNLDDYYSPEVNSNVVALPGVSTPATKNNPQGVSCAVIRDNNNATWVDSFQNIQCYDTLKVNAVVSWIRGKTHNGSGKLKPNLFGMNFQAVSVGQKLIESGVKGGYLDGAGTFTSNLADEIQFVDAGIGEMVNALKSKGELESTTIIITAKHGQSPIDTHLVKMLGGRGVVTTPATLLDNAGLIPFSEAPSNPTGIGPTEDDISLVWLKDSATTDIGVGILEMNAGDINAGQILYGPSITTMFNSPAVDSRTPDIIVQPYSGTIYSGSKKKQAEHGGFAFDDTNVMMLVVNPNTKPASVNMTVETAQVAPTVLSLFGLDPKELEGVRKEGTAPLPDLNYKH
jgi:Type I phosphodiesterase / nucleotide pyrophosphatase